MMACKFCASVMAHRIYIGIEKWHALTTLGLILKAGFSRGRYDDQPVDKLLPRQRPGIKWVFNPKSRHRISRAKNRGITIYPIHSYCVQVAVQSSSQRSPLPF